MVQCVCGCNGRPLNQAPPDTIDYKRYKTCPARLARKKDQRDAKARARNIERSARLRQREEQKRTKRQEREALKEERAREEAAAETYRHEAGLPAKSAGEAMRRKLRTFHGSPCSRGHSGVRDARSGECVTCRTFDKKRRDAMKRGAFPESLSDEERLRVLEIYEEARKHTDQTGIPHHVDHVKPLAAGGRHHPDNLQILTAEQNLKKGAKWKGGLERPFPPDVDVEQIQPIAPARKLSFAARLLRLLTRD